LLDLDRFVVLVGGAQDQSLGEVAQLAVRGGLEFERVGLGVAVVEFWEIRAGVELLDLGVDDLVEVWSMKLRVESYRSKMLGYSWAGRPSA